ncbi:DUF6351 family protein [Altererythrobacter sp. Root672]|uniref:DUF6351 family protein n=1 Tax=Altererythrobacter sp. Root672 TaxID=1736584 RepID=UPI0006FBBFBA|nr:DUF6351 family protein [Altererythrobacter sp. Root672]KRA83875.1 feruloyl esterase [Altererythrobacter sp. Root672]
MNRPTIRRARLALTLSLPLLAVAASPALSADGDKGGACSALVGADFGKGVEITSATSVPAVAPGTRVQFGFNSFTDAGVPAHCRVEGVINSRTGAQGKAFGIGFELALPEPWNGRFLLQGGGGLNGSVGRALGDVAAGGVPALSRGFAVVSHDSGHKGAVFDASFSVDQRAALDFAEASVRTVTLVAKDIVQQHYGREIAHSYMAGCSTGGRESMLASQRYPELFDGIVVGAPAMRTGFSNLGAAYAKVQFNQAAPRDAEGKPLPEQAFSPADRQTILKGMLAQCDALDGLEDGMIMNVAQCRFQPAKLQCSRAKQDGCLSGAQVGALERAFAGPKDASGHPLYVPVPFDTGVVDTSGPISGYIVSGKADILGPANRDLAMDLDAAAWTIRSDAMQRLTDTNVWTNLNTFLGKGSKILFYHGVSDPWFSANDTWDYWQRAREANGAEAWDNASRFYMVPGMAHCGGGNAFDRFDLLSEVVAWVEEGKAPSNPVARRSSAPDEERPLCQYPAYPRYKGGDSKKASSYVCTQPTA